MSIEATMSGLGPEAVFQKRAGEKILVARRRASHSASWCGGRWRAPLEPAFARRPKIVTVYNVTHIDC